MSEVTGSKPRWGEIERKGQQFLNVECIRANFKRKLMHSRICNMMAMKSSGESACMLKFNFSFSYHEQNQPSQLSAAIYASSIHPSICDQPVLYLPSHHLLWPTHTNLSSHLDLDSSLPMPRRAKQMVRIQAKKHLVFQQQANSASNGHRVKSNSGVSSSSDCSFQEPAAVCSPGVVTAFAQSKQTLKKKNTHSHKQTLQPSSKLHKVFQ